MWKCPCVDDWRKKMGYICIYNGILFSIRKNEILPCVTTGMGLENKTELNKTEKAKNHMISLICGKEN